MPNIGRQVMTTDIVYPTRVSIDGSPVYKHGGITLDTATLTAASGSDATLPDGSVIRGTSQYMRYGQILCKIGVAEVQTLTFTGGPTAGDIFVTLPSDGVYAAETTGALAFNVSAANMQIALEGLSRIGAGNVGVARTGAGTAGDPYIYTITVNRALGNVPTLTSTNTFTGGTTPTGTHATTTSGGASAGKYGPYDPAATDGRQTLARGSCFILDQTYVLAPAGASFPSTPDQMGNVFDAGRVWKSRVLQSETVTASKALGPTLANFLTAFPAILLNDEPG